MTTSRNLMRTGMALSIGLAGALLVLHAWQLPPFHGSVETTDNAYVRGQVTMISPQIAGYVTAVAVKDFDQVEAGQLLVRIDDRIYQQKLTQAEATQAMKRAALEASHLSQAAAEARIKSSEAQLASTTAAHELAQSSAHRIETLLPRGFASQSTADQSRSALAQAEAARNQSEAALEVARQELRSIIVNRESLEAELENAEAAIELARIDLQNTRIVAPAAGRMGEIGVRLGQYVTAGSSLASLVPLQRWVIANFKETQLSGIRTGQPVTFTVDALRHANLTGHVEAFAPATGSEFSVLRPDNATGNFTKVSQRLPIRILIDPDQPLAERLAPGMSVVVSIETATRPSQSPAAEAARHSGGA